MRNPNTVIKPTKTNDKLHRNLIVGVVIVFLTSFMSSQGWLFYQSFLAKADRAETRTLLLEIDKKLDSHIMWGVQENIKNQNRISGLENGKHPATANRWTEQDALLLDEQDKRWTEQNFEKK